MSSLYLVPDWNYRGHSDIDTTSRKSENTNTNSITCSSYRSSHRCLQCTPASCNLLHPAPGFWLLASVNCDHSLHCTADTDFWMVTQYSILTVSVWILITLQSCHFWPKTTLYVLRNRINYRITTVRRCVCLLNY